MTHQEIADRIAEERRLQDYQVGLPKPPSRKMASNSIRRSGRGCRSYSARR